jgi:putative oxidoreductase
MRYPCLLNNWGQAMLDKWFGAKANNPVQGLDIVRVGVALIILMHPLHGFFHYENIAPNLGAYLTDLGYPAGVPLAWLVLILQTVCSLALLGNRAVVPACLGHIVVVGFGILHFHRPHGWFVTGPGEHGMEWGFILLTCLFGVMWGYWPRKLVDTHEASR